jgi:hypothetical protein
MEAAIRERWVSGGREGREEVGGREVRIIN